MSRDDAASGAGALAWGETGKSKGALPGFLVLSLAAHALTFFLFQIEYPARVTISAPAPGISLLDPQRAEHHALLRLIEAEDPAPAVSAQSTVPLHLLEVLYRPSYATVRTVPQTLPEPAAAVQFPPARDPIAVIRSASPVPPDPPRKTAPRATRLIPGEGLADRAVVRPLAIVPEKPFAEPLLPARFLIGVTAKGEVRFSFLQSSSGDARADAAAASALDRTAFAPADPPMTWSHVTVTWGDEIYRAAPGARQK